MAGVILGSISIVPCVCIYIPTYIQIPTSLILPFMGTAGVGTGLYEPPWHAGPVLSLHPGTFLISSKTHNPFP